MCAHARVYLRNGDITSTRLQGWWVAKSSGARIRNECCCPNQSDVYCKKGLKPLLCPLESIILKPLHQLQWNLLWQHHFCPLYRDHPHSEVNILLHRLHQIDTWGQIMIMSPISFELDLVIVTQQAKADHLST